MVPTVSTGRLAGASIAHRPATRAVAALSLLACLLVAGCNAGRADDGANGAPIRLYGSDGNMSTGFGGSFKDQPGLLNGMKGTAPLTPVTEEFRRRLKSIDPNLDNLNYASEA